MPMGEGAGRQCTESGKAAQKRREWDSACTQDVILAAASLALALSKGRTQYEVETLINLFSLTTSNLQSILAQGLICQKTQDYLETPL